MAETTQSPTALRKLSNVELFSSTRHSLGLYRSVIATCRYNAPASSPVLDEATLYAAMGILVSAQPMMRVGILEPDGRNARFCHIPRIDLSRHVDISPLFPVSGDQSQTRGPPILDPDCVQAAVSAAQGQHHDRLWQDIDTVPPWRVHVLCHGNPHVYDIIFASHHSLLDGTSCGVFHQQLLAALDTNPAPSSPLLDFPLPPSLPPGKDSAIPCRLSISFVARALWKEYAPSWLKQNTVPWHGRAIDFSLPYETCILPVTIPQHILVSLVSACRENGTSITGLFHALILSSFSINLPDASYFTASTPINLRPYLSQPTPYTLRNLVSMTIHSFPHDSIVAMRKTPQSDTLIWQHARAIKSQLTHRLNTLPNDDPVDLLSYVNDWHDFWNRKNGNPREESWEISNIGVLEQPRTSSWRISNIIFSNGSMVAGSPIALNIASIANGPCTATISWQRGVVPDHLPTALANDLTSYTNCFYKTQSFFAPS